MLTGIAASRTTVLLSHTLQFALMLAIFSNLAQHTCWGCAASRRGSHFSRYGPAYMVCVSVVLVMAHPTYLVLKDSKHLPPAGKSTMVALHCCTVIGYVFVILGTLWAADVWTKLRRAWNGN